VTGNEGFLINPKPRKGKVKTLRASFGVGLFTLAVLLPGPLQVCRGQILVGGAANQTAAPLASVPATGTFFSATLNVPPWPMDWLPPQVPVYAWEGSSNVFIVDDRGWDYSASGNAMFAAAAQSSRMGTMELSGPPTPGDTNSGGTNSGGGISMPMRKYTTNDLYLEITVTLKGMPSNLLIHTPWYVTNGVYNVLTTTNLAPPIAWQWFTNTASGQTNITLTNTTEPQRFFALGATNSSAGTDFWVAFMATAAPNDVGDGGWGLYISSQVSNNVTVTALHSTITTPLQLAAGMGTNIVVGRGDIIWAPDTNDNHGIHITADQPVSVYGVYTGNAASWAFTAYPTPMLGTNYCLMARPALDGDTDTSQFAIVATADNTTVRIAPSTNANLETYSGGFYTSIYTNIMTNQGDTYQVWSGTGSNDVTGTRITSDKPIAVFAGAGAAYVPDANTLCANPLVQEQMPVASWGTQALALSFAGRTNGDTYRVLTTNEGTTLTVLTSSGVATNTLHAGMPYDTNLDGWVVFQANNPIQVAQFANGCYFDGANNLEGDPLEMLLPPAGRWLTSYNIAVLANNVLNADFDQNFVNLIVPQSAISTIMMDTTNISTNNFLPIGSSGFSGARLPVTGGFHNIKGLQPFEVQVYGWGNADSYGYIGGLTTFP